MYTVKRLLPNTTLTSKSILVHGTPATIGTRTPNTMTWAIVDSADNILFDTRGNIELHSRKGSAELTCKWYNQEGK